MKSIKLSCSNLDFNQTIHLDGSKSISNRLLIINALSTSNGVFENLSTSDDTLILQQLLGIKPDLESAITYDVGHAGTCFRFLTSYLSIQKGTQILTGSNRMKQRPIGPLVDALNTIGAKIEYLEEDGFPPLKISSPSSSWNQNITIDASISSQFISSLLMIAPALPNGLNINLEGQNVSTPYIEMTIKIMESCGVPSIVEYTNNGIHSIKVKPAIYQLNSFVIESDWSAASYYYAIAAFSNSTTIRLKGLFENSLQSDQAIVDICAPMGIETTYTNDGILIMKSKDINPGLLEVDFIKCPDIAQTVMTIVGGQGLQGLYSGLQTLKIKETDRFQAMKTELGKLGVILMQLPQRFSKVSEKAYYMSEEKASTNDTPVFDTYNDHRMAMSLASLCVLFEIQINNPEVVSKSYPKFWSDLELLGVNITSA